MWASETNPSVRWVRFAYLLVLTAFVGAIWGLQRITIPLIAEDNRDRCTNVAACRWSTRRWEVITDKKTRYG
jgi:hypothetical protein